MGTGPSRWTFPEWEYGPRSNCKSRVDFTGVPEGLDRYRDNLGDGPRVATAFETNESITDTEGVSPY